MFGERSVTPRTVERLDRDLAVLDEVLRDGARLEQRADQRALEIGLLFLHREVAARRIASAYKIVSCWIRIFSSRSSSGIAAQNEQSPTV